MLVTWGGVAIRRVLAALSLTFAVTAVKVRHFTILQKVVKFIGGVVAIVTTLAVTNLETFSTSTVFSIIAVVILVANASVWFRFRARTVYAIKPMIAIVVVVTARASSVRPRTLSVLTSEAIFRLVPV